MSNQEEIKNLRREYGKGKIDFDHTSEDPFDMFKLWWDNALQQLKHIEINACTLATTDKQGQPNARIILLKYFDRSGFSFYTNYESCKGQEIADNPNACLLFYWKELEQQIRLKGILTKLGRAANERYFSSRPKDSQIGALISNQSQPLINQQFLEDKFIETKETYKNKEIICPQHWGGYSLQPHYYEFWQGQANRLHQRLLYQKNNVSNSHWHKVLLYP